MTPTAGPAYPPQFTTRLGTPYHGALRHLAQEAEVTMTDYLRGAIELLEQDPTLAERVALRAHNLAGLPGQR